MQEGLLLKSVDGLFRSDVDKTTESSTKSGPIHFYYT